MGVVLRWLLKLHLLICTFSNREKKIGGGTFVPSVGEGGCLQMSDQWGCKIRNGYINGWFYFTPPCAHICKHPPSPTGGTGVPPPQFFSRFEKVQIKRCNFYADAFGCGHSHRVLLLMPSSTGFPSPCLYTARKPSNAWYETIVASTSSPSTFTRTGKFSKLP